MPSADKFRSGSVAPTWWAAKKPAPATYFVLNYRNRWHPCRVVLLSGNIENYLFYDFTAGSPGHAERVMFDQVTADRILLHWS